MNGLLREVCVAERHRRKFDALHPQYGDGSLMAAAGGHPRCREAFPSDPRYLRALICVLSHLLDPKISFVSDHDTLS